MIFLLVLLRFQERMPILSVIPADQVLAVAIKDATVSTSTVNPARITTAVQKMRPVRDSSAPPSTDGETTDFGTDPAF